MLSANVVALTTISVALILQLVTAVRATIVLRPRAAIRAVTCAAVLFVADAALAITAGVSPGAPEVAPA